MITNMTETELAYTAGIIDGEGTVVIERSSDHKSAASIRYRMHLTVCIREKHLCEWLQLRFGGKLYLAVPRSPKHADYWMWRVTCAEAVECLSAIRPYLLLKGLQADNAIRFQAEIVPDRRIVLSDEEMAIREACYLTQKGLNQRGPVTSREGR